MADPKKVTRAWKDIGFLVEAEVHEFWMDLKVFRFFVFIEPDAIVWEGQAPPGHAFNRAGYTFAPDPVLTTAEAQVYLSGAIKGDGCANLRFDEQEHVALHFCSREQATNIGVLLGRLYDLAGECVAAWDTKMAARTPSRH